MTQCPFCAGEIRDDATVCKHCTRGLPVHALSQRVPTAFIVPIGVLLLGTVTMLISAMPGAPRLLLLPGWLISWAGAALILKDYGGAVVRIGGGFILSLVLMALAVSCGAR